MAKPGPKAGSERTSDLPRRVSQPALKWHERRDLRQNKETQPRAIELYQQRHSDRRLRERDEQASNAMLEALGRVHPEKRCDASAKPKPMQRYVRQFAVWRRREDTA